MIEIYLLILDSQLSLETFPLA
uniref:Uncharacterized protein n=1 Tax=Rhizophora mucronata TaxID=61149 RepID=A0A2P2PSB3_RHIMU